VADGNIRIIWNGEIIERKVRVELGRRCRRALAETRRAVVTNISVSSRKGDASGRWASLPGEFPRAYSRSLARSVFDDMTGDLEGIVGINSAGPAAKYALRLERGGVILAHGKRMAVPVSQMARAYRGSVRSFPKHLELIRRPNKPDLLVEIPQTKKGPSNKRAWIIHFVLVNKVTISPHPYMSRTAREMEPRIRQIFAEPMNL
jgi:hypothetical protein